MAISVQFSRTCDSCGDNMQDDLLAFGEDLPEISRKLLTLSWGEEVYEFEDLCDTCTATTKAFISSIVPSSPKKSSRKRRPRKKATLSKETTEALVAASQDMASASEGANLAQSIVDTFKDPSEVGPDSDSSQESTLLSDAGSEVETEPLTDSHANVSADFIANELPDSASDFSSPPSSPAVEDEFPF